MVYDDSLGDQGEKYTSKMDWRSISNFAATKLKSFVGRVIVDNYEQFILNEPSKYKVLLFTQRKVTSPIIKALSKQYKDKLIFGEVKLSETTLAERFGVKNFPTLLVVTDAFHYKGDLYKGDMTIE